MTDSLIIAQQISLEQGWMLNVLTPRIATITDSKGIRKTAYFGFRTKREAEVFKLAIDSRHLCTASLVRNAQRLSRYPFECKTWGIATELILHLVNRSI